MSNVKNVSGRKVIHKDRIEHADNDYMTLLSIAYQPEFVDDSDENNVDKVGGYWVGLCMTQDGKFRPFHMTNLVDLEIVKSRPKGMSTRGRPSYTS